MFINDFVSFVSDGETVGVNYDENYLSYLLFANDVVLFSETKNGL